MKLSAYAAGIDIRKKVRYNHGANRRGMHAGESVMKYKI